MFLIYTGAAMIVMGAVAIGYALTTNPTEDMTTLGL